MSRTIRFGFLTDTHFTVTRTAFRTDDFLQSVLSKVRQCYAHFRETGCAFAIHGGDVFDKHRSYSYPMLLAVRDAFADGGLPTAFIWGQHDLCGYARDSKEASNLAFLREISDGRLREVGDRLDIEGVRLYASHVDSDPREILPAIPKGDLPSVAVVHALLTNEPSPFPGTVDISEIGAVNPVLVLSGDLHAGYAATKIGNTLYCNPGALARTERTDRRPQALVCTLSEDGGVWSAKAEEIFPECPEAPFPEEREETAKAEAQDSEKYIEAFERFKTETKDIYARLRKVGEEHGIDREVLDYIESKRPTA